MAKPALSPSAKLALKAMREAVKLALTERKRLGVSMSIWVDGKLVVIPAAKITARWLNKFSK